MLFAMYFDRQYLFNLTQNGAKMKKTWILLSFLLPSVLFGSTACAVTNEQSTTGAYIDDATITTRIKSRLAADDNVSATRISVETLNGVVVLSGFAISNEEKKRAAEIARGVPNVKRVKNKLIVEPPNKKQQ